MDLIHVREGEAISFGSCLFTGLAACVNINHEDFTTSGFRHGHGASTDALSGG